MSLQLFEHNQAAFDAALEMLGDTGKAAVVHPTGTGKSYIGFKLCEQFPDKTVCWLSPSEYIYKTQLENLKEDSGGWQPENVKFFTYAKLMLMTDSELAEIKPDYIILDEFHRCGAEMWGEGVDRLLKAYPKVPLLGLTATAVRYLDNQRNMVDELFDGNIASEMTLGEAIVRGILKPPKYVMSVFAYQEDYKKLESRVRHTKTKATRDQAEQYLEALRRALEKADGMDVIFDKHITDRTGKYIVFCSNIDHLREMQRNVATWFNKIDKEPHIYTAYSLDPTTEQAFENFKKDESDHLKLLFCIDMLNEGVHVENISGVVLFRPTVSPIIYKQQIGRALSASKTKDPIIFDIVNNIENLYSIGTIQQEMQIAISYYRSLGEERYIVNDRFEVVDEVRDAKELFDQLNDTLSASWDVMFGYAEQYYHEHGNLEIPKDYKTRDGYSLGFWIFTQRQVYKGAKNTSLTEMQIKKLESIGMVWENMRDLQWNRNYQKAKEYFEANGHLRIPGTYVTDDGVQLGQWIAGLRSHRKNGSNQAFLNSDRIEKLDAIGMIWDVPDYLWNQYYSAALDYFKVHGDLDVPKDYVTDDGIKLYHWLTNVKEAYRNPNKIAYRLTDAQIQMLNELNIEWRTQNEIIWDNAYAHAEEYFDEYGDLEVAYTYQSPDGFKLGKWITYMRDKNSKGKLNSKQISKLNSIQMVWKKVDPWEKRFAIAKQYYREHGDLEIPTEYVVDGIWIGQWLKEQRQIKNGKIKNKSLSAEQIGRLESIGMYWGNKRDREWTQLFEEVKEYFAAHGDCDIPAGFISKRGTKLGAWLQRQRNCAEKGELSEERVRLLQSLGILVENKESDSWNIMYAAAKEYYEQNGDLLVPPNYVTESGLDLGKWIRTQRTTYKFHPKSSVLSAERIQLLEAIDMAWDSYEYRWNRNYQSAVNYYRKHGSLKVPTGYVDEDGVRLYHWLQTVRQAYHKKNKSRLTSERIQSLNQIGMTW